MSTYSTVACVTLGGSKRRPSSSRRASGTLRHAGAHRRGADVGLLVDSGEDREQGGLACHGQADNGGSHIWNYLQGNIHLAENLFDDALAHVGAALHQGGAGIDDHAMREQRHGQPLHVVGDGVIAAFEQAPAPAPRGRAPASRAG